MTYEDIIARSRKRVVPDTTYNLPGDAPIEAAWNPNDRIRPSRVEVKEFDDGTINVSVSGYHVKKDGTRYERGANWHGVGAEAQRRYEAALGFVRVPRES